jgi:hypothetical protein
MRPSYAPVGLDREREESLRAARAAVPLIVQRLSPKSVIDLGCNDAAWLRVFADFGIIDVIGADFDEPDPDTLQIPVERYVRVNLSKPFRLERRFELAMCLEVAEHLPPIAADTIVESLTLLSPVVLFSAAIPFQGGHRHLNEQWQSWWAERFMRCGYLPCDCFRDEFWSNEAIAPWYAQNALLFLSEEGLARYPELGDAVARSQPVRNLVHSETYLQHADLKRSSLRRILNALPLAATAAIRRRLARVR